VTTPRPGPETDPLLAGLAALAVEPPQSLLDRVAARWVRAPGPVGDVDVAFTDHGVALLALAGGRFADAFHERFHRPLLPAARPPAGLLPALRTGRPGGLRFDLRELTAFQREVLQATRTVPRGQVRPYAWVAQQIGHPGAVRAVGSALARNPVPILIPCHRITRSDGMPGDYVFGPALKEALLRAEEVDLDGLRTLARDEVHYLASDTTGIFCFPTCHNARRITAPHRHGFRAPAEARAAGYRPCRACRPGLARTA
jgi:O-6-methylguanine DNA methyltransferase